MGTTIVNARTGRVVASAVEIADTRSLRRRGLLGRDRLDPCAALVLTPCFVIHTISMRFAIDALFLDREGVVLKAVANLEPGRIALARRSHAVVEFAAGVLAARDVAPGDRLYLEAGLGTDAGAIHTPLSSTTGDGAAVGRA